MRGQQPGMSQHRPRQQVGLTDMQYMQFFEQQTMFKQLQELQRQKQFHQLDEEGKHANPMKQLYTIEKKEATNQLRVLVNGAPTHDASSYLLPNGPMGGDYEVPSTSQIFMTNMYGGCFAEQGYSNQPLSSNEQVQPLNSMSVAPQEIDKSLYGTPITSTRILYNQLSNLQGIFQDNAEMSINVSENQLEKPIMQSSSAFNISLQADQLTLAPNQVSLQDSGSNSRRKNQGEISFAHSIFDGKTTEIQLENFHETNSIKRNAFKKQEASWSGTNSTCDFGLSQDMVSLIPVAEKILLNSDNNMCDPLVNMSGNIGSGDCGNSLENIDYSNGFSSIQSGTWIELMHSAVAEASSSDTGLPDERSGLSFSGNQHLALSDSGKQQADWADTNLQSSFSLTSRPSPLFPDTESSRDTHCYQQSCTKVPYEQGDNVHSNMYDSSIQQPFKKTSPPQSSFEGINQACSFLHLENASEVTLDSELYEQSESPQQSAGVEFDAENMQGFWVHRPSSNMDSHSCYEPKIRDINESPSFSRHATLKIHESEQCSESSDLKIDMQMGINHDDGTSKDNDNRISNYFVNLNGRLVQVKSSTSRNFANSEGSHRTKYQHQRSVQVFNSSVNMSDKGSGDTCDKAQENCYQEEISNGSYSSDQSHPTFVGGSLRDNSLSCASYSDLLISQSQNSTYQVAQGSKSYKQEHLRLSNLASTICNNATYMEKGLLPDSQLNAETASSFDVSAGFCTQNKMTSQTCQNMHELIHEAGQSRKHETVTQFCSSNLNPSYEMLEASDASAGYLQHKQFFISQGFGSWIAPTSSVHPSPPQNYCWDNRSCISEQKYDKTSESNIQSSSNGASINTILYSRNQMQPPDTARKIHFNLGLIDTCHPGHTDISFIKVSGQQIPVTESIPVAQCKVGMKVSNSLCHSIDPSNSNKEIMWVAAQRCHDQNIGREGNGSEFGICSINSQHFADEEEQPGKENYWQEIQNERVSLGNLVTSNRDIEAFDRPLWMSQSLNDNYFSLHQGQAKNDVEANQNKRGLKRFKKADSSVNARRVSPKVGQHLLAEYYTDFKDVVDDEMTTSSSGDNKMLRFYSDERDDQSRDVFSQLALKGVQPQNVVSFGPGESQNCSVYLTTVKYDEPQKNSQLTTSRFESFHKWETLKSGQMLPMYDVWQAEKNHAQPIYLGKSYETSLPHASAEQVNRIGSSPITSITQDTTTAFVASEGLSSPLTRSKKRKTRTFELLPWHKEVTEGSQRLRNISMAELEWAHALSRLVQKVEDVCGKVQDRQPAFQACRRLILTTQLMQQLFRPTLGENFAAEGNSVYETVTYIVAKLSLGEACSLMSCSRSNLHLPTKNGNMDLFVDKSEYFSLKIKGLISARVVPHCMYVNDHSVSGKLNSVGDRYSVKAVENFIVTLAKLETDLLRLRKSSILDLRVEYQDLQRFSIITRLTQFHTRRSQANGNATVLTQKTSPQRYVTALAMPKNIPQGVHCLSL
ncbi:hypothetical protein GIB67_000679 [Kingdonia uniflora]|uniref:Uncharacterized protein n=1 Tax=Kingdonia uniflora TaxID=39325 RepID=A0A7J7ND55_9MAGN|nr:hypothetical protein GIB67_000679 [Kingdonia uniflora]